MRNKIGAVLWGIAFIVAGVGFAGEAFGIWNFDLFFHGWWTLFIIVPSVVALSRSGLHLSPIIGIIIGVLFLLSAQGILPRDILAKLFLPVMLLMIGGQLICKQLFGARAHQPRQCATGGGGCAVFAGRNERVTNDFTGAVITAVLGGYELDLRDARIVHDARIDATAILGGIDVILPPNVHVRVSSMPVLGGVDCKAHPPADPSAPVLWVNATAILGGVEIK